jgi:DNA-binding CsgD family transcriptional regulator
MIARRHDPTMIHQYTDPKTRVDLLADVLDCVSHGILIVTAQGDILEQNRTAAEILRDADGWLSGCGRPCPASMAERVRLRSHLIAAANAGAAAAAARWSMAVSRPSGKRPFLVSIERMNRRSGLAAPALLITIVDPEMGVLGATEWLRQLYDLTRAETRLAGELAAGFSTRQSAARLCVSTHTIRAQIRAIFAKTGVRRQSELVRLMYLHTAPFCNEIDHPGSGPEIRGSLPADSGNVISCGVTACP